MDETITAEARHSDQPVRICAYDSSWPERFAAERALLKPALGESLTGGIHHVGSTAVRGLEAKPTIDVLAGVHDLASSRECFAALGDLDYIYTPYRTDEMHWFCKPSRTRRTHHLHLVPTGSRRYREELEFRDILRSRPVLAAAYVALKRRLAAEHEHDRDAYTDAKHAFIAQALRDTPPPT